MQDVIATRPSMHIGNSKFKKIGTNMKEKRKYNKQILPSQEAVCSFYDNESHIHLRQASSDETDEILAYQ